MGKYIECKQIQIPGNLIELLNLDISSGISKVNYIITNLMAHPRDIDTTYLPKGGGLDPKFLIA